MSKDTPAVDPEDAWHELPVNCHACLIYDSDAQRDAIVPGFMRAGLRQGELVRYFADVTTPDVVLSWVSDGEPGPAEATDDGPLRIAEAERAYCPDGRFEPRRVVDRMLPGYELVKAAGFRGVRTIGEMSWALRGLPGSDRLVEYEALINTIETTFPHIGMCQYDARLFDGATLFQMLRVHPHVIAGGRVVRNPYYVRPEVLLAPDGSPS